MKKYRPRYSPYLGSPGADEVQTIKNTGDVGKVEKLRLAPLGASQDFTTYVGFPRIGLQNRRVIPPLNISIISWQQLVHTVLVIKAVSHLRVQPWMHSCIQSCKDTKKRLLPCQLTYPLLIVYCIQNLALVR